MEKNIILLFLVISLLMACSLDNEETEYNNPNTITIEKNLLPNTSTQTYLLLTNPTENALEVPTITVNGSQYLNEIGNYNTPIRTFSNTLQRQLDINIPLRELTKSISTTVIDYSQNIVGDKSEFFIYYNSTGDYESEIFKLESKTTLTKLDNITLFIWVDENDDPPDGALDYIESKLNSIFAQETAIFGTHWGQHSYSNLISNDKKDIHIMFTDIDNDKNNNPNGVVYGYYDSNNTSLDEESNQCNAIVIDSYNLFNGTYPIKDNYQWKDSDIITALTLSTIIHEFQHMIHFFNKKVINNHQDTFFNEMFSMIAEDIMSEAYLTYIYNGETYKLTPDIGRIPTFNFFWDENSTFLWDSNGSNTLNNYSKSYALGAYLIRNYGLELIQEYMKLEDYGKNGIITALNNIDSKNEHTVDTLLTNFGTAILKSSNSEIEENPYMFNNSITLNIDDEEYNLQPINMFDGEKYFYDASGDENNRLICYDFEKTTYHAPFYPLQLHEFNMNSCENWYQFEYESNIYIDLGVLSSEDEIIIDLDTTDRDIIYKLIY